MENNSVLEPLHSEKELQQQWLEKLFLKKLGSLVTVLSWHCVTPSDREGFLSDIAFVKVRYTSQDIKETESQLVFKFLPQDDVKKQFVLDGGLAEREAEFYKITRNPVCREICHKSGIVLPVPECYFAGYTEDCITIVMQDLNTENYKTLIVKEGSTVAQTKTALRAIAVIHAIGYLYLAQYKGAGNLGTIAQPVSSDILDQLFIPNLQTLAKMYEGTPTADTIKMLIPFTTSLHNYPLKYPLFNTFLHGDYWAGQLLFSDDETKAIIIDWQFFYIGNPVCDIMAMFFMSSDINVLENHLEEVMNDYWSTFTKVIKANGTEINITFDQLMTNVEDLWVSGFIILVASIHDFIPAGNLTDERLRAAIKFLENRGMFTKLIDELSCHKL
ncbi:uncharacterized protein [Procambarus clarkii]|uniref:uncharacterized protein n=1 Tax=Procambarus clarkii TaxID=6728 RepID=UPI001E675267|nr:uncharacterized protein LOC123762253 isoform X2 [Procambarus clarkii]